jgi:hypothetical protein
VPASGDGALRVILSVALGLGLAAACGFRVFVPLLVAALAARFAHLPLAAGFDWLSGTPALVALGTATALEVGAYYIPWLDHALDAVATPAAVGAGILAAASTVTELPPAARWGVSIIGGGAVAGLVQGASVVLRLKSTALTGGLANPVLATAELIGATGMALLAIALPLLALLLLIFVVVFATRATGRLLFGRGRPASSA